MEVYLCVCVQRRSRAPVVNFSSFLNSHPLCGSSSLIPKTCRRLCWLHRHGNSLPDMSVWCHSDRLLMSCFNVTHCRVDWYRVDVMLPWGLFMSNLKSGVNLWPVFFSLTCDFESHMSEVVKLLFQVSFSYKQNSECFPPAFHFPSWLNVCERQTHTHTEKCWFLTKAIC